MLIMDELEINLTISIGLVKVIPEKHQIPSAFFAADKALYSSKHSGRNRLTIGDVENEKMDSPVAKLSV
ncbi:MAG: PleD family two-component response regulator [Paraglaciecola sp.]|jgi:PleD family two-component response regulator